MSLIFVIAVLTVGWILYQKYFKALISQGKSGQFKLALIALGLIFLILAVTGRAPAVFAIIGAALTQVLRFGPLFLRFMPSLKKAYTNSSNPGAGNQSQVVTNTLRMTLDHASGSMDGEILAGSLAGRQLQSLSIQELKELHHYCEQHDAEACRLLMSFIARERADHWDGETEYASDDQSATGRVSSSAMDKNEAIAILGLEAPYTREDITLAHRSLMGKFHPDKGGNTYLATKLNNARDLLLDQIKKV